MTDAKNRTDTVTMETGPVICGGCHRKLTPLAIEEIEGIKQLQLRAGRVLILRIEANCLDCGWSFEWNIRQKDIEKMTLKYNQILQRYNPE